MRSLQDSPYQSPQTPVRSGRRITCKYLAVGYDEVIVCSSEINHLQRTREQLETKL